MGSSERHAERRRLRWRRAVGALAALGVGSCIELAPVAEEPDASDGCPQPVLKAAAVIATGQAQPFAVLAAGDEIWWSNEDGGAMRAAADGNDVTSIGLPQGISRITGLRLDADHLYLSAYYSGAILRAPRSGSAASVWVDGQYAIGLALDAEHVYWPDDVASAIRRGAKSASAPVTPETVATGQADPRFITLDATHVYWTTKVGGVRRKAKAGGEVEPVAEAPPGSEVWDLVVDDAPDGFVYWRDGNAVVGRVMRARKSGAALTVLAELEPGPRLLALDGAYLYWTGNTSQSVSRVPVAGGCKELVVTAQPGAHGIAVNATHLFWTSWTLGTISRTVK